MIPSPLTLFNQIDERLTSRLVAGGEFLDPDTFEFRRLWADCDRLQKQNPVDGSFMKAWLSAGSGDRAATEYWLANAERNNAGDRVIVERFRILYFLGYTREAADLFYDAFSKRGAATVDEFISYACSGGWFSRVVDLVAKCREAKLVHKATSQMAMSPLAAQILARQRFTEEMVIEATGEAYAIMRAEKTIWQGCQLPVTLHDVGTPNEFVLFSYPLAVSAERTADLNWQLTERLVSRDLDAPGCVVKFVPGNHIAALTEQEELTTA